LGGTKRTGEVLGLAADVETVESECCVMAGLSGYEKERYEVSMKMAERGLFATVRNADDRVVFARREILAGSR
jgi:hypothetical protein